MLGLLLALVPVLANSETRNTDGRDPRTIPKLDVPESPEWEDVEHPPFESYPVDAAHELLDGALLEQFATPDALDAWNVVSGEWRVEEPFEFRGFDGDFGLVLKTEQAQAAVARRTPRVLYTASGDKPLVVQYEVKTQQPLRCGGAYIKLLPEEATTDSSSDDSNSASIALDAKTSYVVMFGPDRCGATDKVHLILQRDGVEHHLQNAPRTHSGLLSTLYTLVIRPDQTFEIRRDGNTVRAGSLLDSDEFEPPLVVPSEIDDPTDSKPEDWVDEELMPDPNEPTKPEDWDESQEHLIPDPEATKPAGWHEDWPLFVADPAASKPDLWDDDEDGEWRAPEILNPRCAVLDLDSGLEGCGEWLAPLIRNPNFRGKWTPALVPNPEYRGEWAPQRIANPDFDADARPNALGRNVAGIGFELLTVQGNILFDNIYVGHSERDAENIGNATWSPKYFVEAAAQGRYADARRLQADAKARERYDAATQGWGVLGSVLRYSGLSRWAYLAEEWEDLKLSPRAYVVDMYNDFIDLFRANKREALRQYPVTALAFGLCSLVVTMLVFGLLNTLSVLVTGKQMPRAAAINKPAAKKPVVVEEPDANQQGFEKVNDVVVN